MMYKFVDEQSANHPVDLLCNTMEISRSAYYAYRKGDTFKITEKRSVLLSEVKKVFNVHRKRYGSRRIKHELHRQGIPIGRDKVRNLMKSQNLVAIQPKSFVPKTTDSRHTLGYSQNVLAQRGFPKRLDEAYVGDITYLPTTSGEWLYLMTWMDLCSRCIVGWKIEDHMEDSLVIEALELAFAKRKPSPGLIVHTDRAGQFASADFRYLLASHQCIQSMSKADNPYDNAYAESLFSRFKAELIQKGAFESKEDAIIEVFDYIEVYYNTQRLHSSLRYMPPQEFENKIKQSKL